jgi:hypothetical protein
MLSQNFSTLLEVGDLKTDSVPSDSRTHEILSDLRNIISRQPVARLEIASDGFLLHPQESGFTIKVIPTSDQPILAFAGWHDELDWDVCQGYIEAALAGHLRVRIETLNCKPWKWALETVQPDGEWAELAAMSCLRLHLWKRDLRTHYFQYVPRLPDPYRSSASSVREASRNPTRLG